MESVYVQISAHATLALVENIVKVVSISYLNEYNNWIFFKGAILIHIEPSGWKCFAA